MIKTCKEETCLAEFELEDKEVDWYNTKGYELPKRCKPCRIKRKSIKFNN